VRVKSGVRPAKAVTASFLGQAVIGCQQKKTGPLRVEVWWKACFCIYICAVLCAAEGRSLWISTWLEFLVV